MSFALKQVNSNQSVHGIITSRGSYIAKLEQKTNAELQSQQNRYKKEVVLVFVWGEGGFGGESSV